MVNKKSNKYHKPSLLNWLRYTVHAKVAVLSFIMVFGFGGYYTVRQSFAAAEWVYSSPAGVVFRVEIIYSDGSEVDQGTRTTPIDLNSGGSFYKLTFLSAPSGYTFRQWRTSTYTSTNNPITFSTNNDQTMNIDLNAPTPAPVVSIRANGSYGSTTVTQNTALTLDWSVTNATSCIADDRWSGYKASGGGSEDRSADTATTGVKGYGMNCQGPGGWSNYASVSVNVQAAPAPPNQPPSAPGNVRATSISTNQINLAWNASSDPNGGAIGYSVYQRLSQNGAVQKKYSVNGLSVAAAGLQPATVYYFSVCAIDPQNAAIETCSYFNAATQSVPGQSEPPPAPPPPPPSTNPPPSSPPPIVVTPGSPSSGSTPAPSGFGSPFIQGPSTPSSNLAGADKVPPSLPANLTAHAESDATVLLRWDKSTDDVAVAGYKLERSTDQANWTSVSDFVKNTSYIDTEVGYETKYFYRLQAIDTSNNTSEYSLAEVTTLGFSANVTVQDGGTITSQDDRATVIFPPGAVDEDVQCSVVPYGGISDAGVAFSLVDALYKITCKKASGEVLTKFIKPVTVTLETTPEEMKKYNDVGVFSSSNPETLDRAQSTKEGSKYTTTITDQMYIGIFGKIKGPSILTTIIKTLAVIVLIVGVILGFLYLRYRKQQQEIYQDYQRKAYGL